MGELITVISPNESGKDPNDERGNPDYISHLGEIIQKEKALPQPNSNNVQSDFNNVAATGQPYDERRDEQKRMNQAIGEGNASSPPTINQITLDEALKRFILVADGKRVIDRDNPRHSLAIDEWRLLYRASFRFNEGRRVYVANEWENHPERISVSQRTFKAGCDEFVNDPAGQPSINTWQNFTRTGADDSQLSIFLNHIGFLIPDELTRNRFLDWLAHLEQKPDVLPHTAWLHIAPSTGMGRNWLASVLTRVWAGNVASNFNLVSTLNSDFNGQLSGKVLAIVDEIREGGNDHWKHAEKMKSLITEEVRTINPKYGRVSIEFNSCRWLIFSNHLSAIPLQKTDRRIEVVVKSGKPKSEVYYEELYEVLGDSSFIDSVGWFLKNRDISQYKAGAHAVWSDDKFKAAKANKSDVSEALELLINYWPADLITTSALLEVLSYDDTFQQEKITPAIRRGLEDLGVERLDKRMQVGGKKQYLYCLRNATNWFKATTAESVSNATSKGCPVSESPNHKGCGEFLFEIVGVSKEVLDTTDMEMKNYGV